MPTYSIGTEDFVIFDPPRELYQNEVEQLTFDDVDDSVFRILAKRGTGNCGANDSTAMLTGWNHRWPQLAL